MNRLRTGLGLALFLSLTSGATADVYVTPKHLMILRQGLDSVYGNYVFAVQNTGETEETLKARVMLPKETVDFIPQEGIDPSEVTLAEDGGLMIDKKFPSGVHIVSIGFKTDAEYGHATLTLTPVSEIQSFTLLVPRDSGLTVASQALTDGDASHAPDPQYRPLISSTPLQSGATFTISVDGMPEGRGRLWMVGAAIAALLLVMAGFLALKTRPRITEDESGAQILVG